MKEMQENMSISKRTGYIQKIDTTESKHNSHVTEAGEQVIKTKKKRNRRGKRSEKQIERWNKYKDVQYLKYVSRVVSGQIPASTPPPAILHDVRLMWPQVPNFPDNAFPDLDHYAERQTQHAHVTGVSETRPKLISKLRADAEEFVPRLYAAVSQTIVASDPIDHPGDMPEDFSAIPNYTVTVQKPVDKHDADEIPEDKSNSDDMLGLLSIYTSSSLHVNFNKTVCNEATQEDFGYVYFSTENL